MAQTVTQKGVFLAAFIPFLLCTVIVLAESAWLGYMSYPGAMGKNSSFTRDLIIRFPDNFTPYEVNQTKYGNIPATAIGKASSFLSDIAFTLLVSSIIIIAFGLIVGLRNRKVVPPVFLGNTVIRHEKWVSGGGTLPTTVLSAAPIVFAVAGGATLLSSNLFGGYIIAGLQALLLSILVGVAVQAYGADMIVSNGNADDTLELNSLKAAMWRTLISAQFFLFLIGLILITLKILAF